jgi:hypothetical protein
MSTRETIFWAKITGDRMKLEEFKKAEINCTNRSAKCAIRQKNDKNWCKGDAIPFRII